MPSLISIRKYVAERRHLQNFKPLKSKTNNISITLFKIASHNKILHEMLRERAIQDTYPDKGHVGI